MTAPTARIDLGERDLLIDEIPSMTVDGLGPGERVAIVAEMDDDDGVTWRSWAEFEADETGSIDLRVQPALGGSYDGVDEAGLYWSMTPHSSDDADPSGFASGALQPLAMSFRCQDRGSIAPATLTRRYIDPEVEVSEIREDGIVGTLFGPPGGGPAPAVVTLGGSGGGMRGARETAALLASRGFVAMSLAYFAMEGLPDHLIDIPLEYFEKALTWLRDHEAVAGKPVALSGVSRGGELVLLLGSTYPELIDAIIAWVPSAVMWAGIGPGNTAIGSPSWSLNGRPLPFMRDRVTPEQDAEIIENEPVALIRRYLINLEDRAAIRDAAIPVERIRCPLLLVSGDDDAMWPSTLMSEMVVERLAEHNHQYPYRHLRYEKAGHGIRPPHLPTTITAGRHPIRGFLVARGGEPAAHARAQQEVWPAALEFLRESLGDSGDS